MLGFFWFVENMFNGELIVEKMEVFCGFGVLYIDEDIVGVKVVVQGKMEMQVFIVYL